MTDSSGTPSDAERNLRMALSIGVMDPRLRAACEAVLTALAASQSELKAAKARMWENGHALETATGRIESLEARIAELETNLASAIQREETLGGRCKFYADGNQKLRDHIDKLNTKYGVEP